MTYGTSNAAKIPTAIKLPIAPVPTTLLKCPIKVSRRIADLVTDLLWMDFAYGNTGGVEIGKFFKKIAAYDIQNLLFYSIHGRIQRQRRNLRSDSSLEIVRPRNQFTIPRIDTTFGCTTSTLLKRSGVVSSTSCLSLSTNTSISTLEYDHLANLNGFEGVNHDEQRRGFKIVNAHICQAIEQMRLLSFRYQDDFSARTVEPHAHGVTDEGNELLRAWQVSGPSDSAPFSPGWRLFSVSDMRGITVNTDSFSSARPEYARGDEAMERIFCQL